MLVRLDVTIVTSAPTGGLLNGLAVGNHTVYVDLASVNYVGEGFVGGSIDTDAVQYLSNGDVSGNVTYNDIRLTVQKIVNV